jgi:hypothetical protein
MCVCCKVLYFILSEDDFEIKSKIYSFNLRFVFNHILNSQDVVSVFSEFVFYFKIVIYIKIIYFACDLRMDMTA